MAEQEKPSLAEQIAAMGARISYQKLRAEIASRDPTDRSAQGKSDALAMDQAILASLERLERLEKLEKLAAQLKWIAEERQYGRDASLTAWENLWRLLAALEAQEASDGR